MKTSRIAPIAATLLLAALPGIARAQAPPSANAGAGSAQAPAPASGAPAAKPAPGQGAEGDLRLHLNEDQRAKIKAIRQTQMSQIQDARNDSTLTGPARHQKIMAIRQNADQQIEALLTPDQLATWKEIQAEHRQNHPAGSASGASAAAGRQPRAGNAPSGNGSGSSAGGNSGGNGDAGANPTPVTPE